MNAPSTDTNPSAPRVGTVLVRPSWAVGLYVWLVASAALALYAARTPGVDPLWARLAPWVFLVFALGFTTYRLALVMARRYSAFKAFIQIFVAALFFMVLQFPHEKGETSELLTHREPAVRAMAARLAGYEGSTSKAAQLIRLLDDGVDEVRSEARRSLVKLNDGVDLGPSASAWKERFK